MSDAPSLADLHSDARLIWLIDRARQRLFRDVERALKREQAVSVAQAAALIVIGLRSDVSMRDLALALDIGQPAVTGLVRRMEDRGLVSRIHDARDARVQRLALSDEGRRARQKAMEVIGSVNDGLERSIGTGDLGSVTRFLEDLAQVPPAEAPMQAIEPLSRQA